MSIKPLDISSAGSKMVAILLVFKGQREKFRTSSCCIQINIMTLNHQSAQWAFYLGIFHLFKLCQRVVGL